MSTYSSSTLVPPSSSSSGLKKKHTVFLNFRGVDTRKGFTWYLYNALEGAGIHTFLDEENIEVGEKIDQKLLKAIRESRYCVVVISSGYADSRPCLRELAAMFFHHKEVIPVFYYVDPSDVRHQRAPFEIAFKKHTKHFEPAVVEEWRRAMIKVSQLKGFTISRHSGTKEAAVIQKIVQRVNNRPLRGIQDNKPQGNGLAAHKRNVAVAPKTRDVSAVAGANMALNPVRGDVLNRHLKGIQGNKRVAANFNPAGANILQGFGSVKTAIDNKHAEYKQPYTKNRPIVKKGTRLKGI